MGRSKPPPVPPRVPSQHFANAVRELDGTHGEHRTESAQRRFHDKLKAWQTILDTESDQMLDKKIRDFAHAIRVLLGPTHGP